MSPRRRGRGRHWGAGGGANRGAAGADVQVAPGAQPDQNPPSEALNGSAGAALAERPAGDDAAVPQNGFGHAGSGRPGGGSAGGGSGSDAGNGSGPRRPPKVRAMPVAQDGEEVAEQRHTCTLAQMRRFIKSRPYVPVHELRRRFAIEGGEDEVSSVATDKGIVYVGLPPQEAQFLGDLIKAGEVGCEMLLDPDSPAVIGVFPMRPVART